MDTVSAMHICILLVDTNRASSVRESLVLRLFNFEVVIAACAKEAMDMLQTTPNRFNLVLTAMNLPDIDSFDFMRKMSLENRLPVVMLVDNYDEANITKALKDGAKICLLKPLTISDIQQLWQISLRRVIRQKRKAEFIGECSASVPTPRFYCAPQVVARRNYAVGTSNALPVENQQCNVEPTSPSEDALSDTATSAPPKEEGSLLRKYLENHHSRKQLKRLVVANLNKWTTFPEALPVAPPSPPSPSPPSDIPPISVPLALATYIESFMHATMAVGRAPPGFEHELASRVAATGPPVLAEFEECEGELDPGFLEDLDTEELFDAIEELRD